MHQLPQAIEDASSGLAGLRRGSGSANRAGGRSPERLKTKITLLLGASVIAALALWQWDWDASGVEVWIGEYAWLGALVYVGLLAASVVVC